MKFNNPVHFSRNDLPINKKMKLFWDNNGFLIIDDFYSEKECDKIKNRAHQLINEFEPNSHKSVFNTKQQEKVDDNYFLESGDKIRFFFEQAAFDNNINFIHSNELLINKIGHALHDIDPIFFEFSHRKDLDSISKELEIKIPQLLQSTYIFKLPKIGGEVVPHQDSTFLYTEPESTIGFWVALEDATTTNSCLWAVSGGHKGSLRKIFKRKNNKLIMEVLDTKPFDKMDTPLEVNKGSLILLHGRLPHYSSENKSDKSRQAYTLHIIDGECEFPNFNWLQRSAQMPLKGFID